ALWSVPGGIVGARLLYVIEHADTFSKDLGSVFSVNEGGISIYGGVLGGALVGFLYAYRKHLPVRRIADCAGLGLLVGRAVGRMGAFTTGDPGAKAPALPGGFSYPTPNPLTGAPNPGPPPICGSLSQHPLTPPAVHPVAGLYEPLLLLAAFGICW